MSKKLFIIIGLVLLVAAGAVYAWIYYSMSVARVGVVKRGTAVRVSPANVLVTESFTMEIKSEANGRVLVCNVQPGQMVKAGDILYQIDTKDLDLEIEGIESAYKALKERIALGSPRRFEIAALKENVKNSERLAEQGRIAQQQLEAAKRGLEQKEFELANEEIANKQSLENYEITLKTKRHIREKMTVRVTNDGTVTDAIFARKGDLVGGGQVLCRVIARERLVQAQISEEYFSGVRPGLPVQLQLLGYGGQQFKAVVDRVLPTPDEKNNRYIAYLKVDIEEDRLVPKLTGEALITVDQHENALVIERRALLGNSVFVVRDGHAVLVPVAVGFMSLDQAEILNGLKEGEQIILENPASFRNDEPVRVVQPEAR